QDVAMLLLNRRWEPSVSRTRSSTRLRSVMLDPSSTIMAVRSALRARGHDALVAPEDGELERAMVDLVVLAHTEHDPSWVDVTAFGDHVLRVSPPAALEELFAADLYLALACARGSRDALARLDREHLGRVPKYVASIDSSRTFADEVIQRLRARVLVGDSLGN